LPIKKHIVRIKRGLSKRKIQKILEKREESAMGRRALKLLGVVIIFSALMAFYEVAGAIEYPTKPIQIVAAYAPGGATDIIARIAAATLSDFVGQPVVVLNKPGGGGVVGTAWVAKQKPDGYTLFMASPGPIITQALMTDLPYSRKDFIPLATLCYFPTVLGVLPNSPIKKWQDVVEQAKKTPGKITYCSSGHASTGNILMQGAMLAANIQLKSVPENGCPECMRAVLGGHTDIYVCEPWHEGLRYIANFAPVRSPKYYKDVPTFKEMGYGVSRITWYPLCVQKGTPPEIVAKLRDAIKKAYDSVQFQEMLKGVVAEPYFLSGEETEKMWESDYQNTIEILEKAGIKYKKN
jgi:tripartite-type tricarboxylate transporter receptor subunit TctC